MIFLLVKKKKKIEKEKKEISFYSKKKKKINKFILFNFSFFEKKKPLTTPSLMFPKHPQEYHIHQPHETCQSEQQINNYDWEEF